MSVSLRQLRQPDDYPAMTAVFNAGVDAAGEGEHVTVAQLAAAYEHLDRCDPATDVVVAIDENDELVGYTRVAWAENSDGYREYWFRVAIDGAGNGLERTLFDWAVERATAIAAGQDVPAKRLATWGVDGTSMQALLESAGFAPRLPMALLVRPVDLDVPDLMLPDGVETRPVAPEHLRAIWDAEVEAFKGEPFTVQRTEADWESFRAETETIGTELWQVAWAGDVVVGQVRTRASELDDRPGRRRAWTEDISTHHDWRRRGIASALICASLRQLDDLGFDEAALNADAYEGARPLALYENLGYRIVQRSAVYTRPV